MFNIEFLHIIREFEYQKIISYFVPAANILEIGGGTGYQAKRLSQDGFGVESIDVESSVYADKMDFPVQPYDGRNIPFPDDSFDIVFSSNVLEHITDLPQLHDEIKRVLKPDGYCIHVMPTGAWRFWTNIGHYIELCQRLLLLCPRLIPHGISRHSLNDVKQVAKLMISTARHYAIVPRHGEFGNAITEISTFSVRHWKKHFISHGFKIDKIAPVGLFYTGHMVLGKRMSITLRTKLSRLIGSACVIYKVIPK